MENLLPLITQDRILVDVLKDLHFISSSINIESILIPNKGMVRPSFWNLIQAIPVASLAIARSLPDFIPLLFCNFILEQIIEICATFSSVASEEIQTVSVGDCSRSTSGFRLAVYQPERAASSRDVSVADVGLLIHCDASMAWSCSS